MKEYPNLCLKFQLNNNLFLVRLLDLENFNPQQIQKLVTICDRAFVEAQTSGMQVIINISPLDENFNVYVFFVKLSHGVSIYRTILAFSNDILANLELFLVGIIKQINDIDDKIDCYNPDFNPIPAETNVEDLVREITLDIKHRKK